MVKGYNKQSSAPDPCGGGVADGFEGRILGVGY